MAKSKAKERAQRRHAKERAFQRYGVWCTDQDLDFIVAQIQADEAKFVYRQSRRITLWDVEWADQTVRVVYDKTRKTVVTFLPPDTVGTDLNWEDEINA